MWREINHQRVAEIGYTQIGPELHLEGPIYKKDIARDLVDVIWAVAMKGAYYFKYKTTPSTLVPGITLFRPLNTATNPYPHFIASIVTYIGPIPVLSRLYILYI